MYQSKEDFLAPEDKVDAVLDNGSEVIRVVIKKHLRDLTTNCYQFGIIENDKLAFDYPPVILSGIERLKNKLEYTDIVFNMIPEYFMLGELQKVYEVILGRKLLNPAFHRIIASKVEKTNKVTIEEERDIDHWLCSVIRKRYNDFKCQW